VVIDAPALVSPGAGTMVGSLQPTLRIDNASRTGPAGPMYYEFQVALSSAFLGLVAQREVPERANGTEVTVGPLEAGRTFYWRVRASNGTVTSDWSPPRTFTTPGPIAVPPPAAPLPPSGSLPVSNPGPRPGIAEGMAMVAAVIADLDARGISMQGDCGGFEITRRVAWAFRNRGAGLERKPGGRNCNGHSIDIVIFQDGQTVDMLVGSGVDNGPSWQEHGVLPDWQDVWIAPSNPD
jgi:hypothetical protein